MTTRQILPNRRLGLRFDIVHRGVEFNVMAGLRDGCNVAEVFVSAHRHVGAAVMSEARAAAVIASIALQYGAPLQVIQGALARGPDGTPDSTIGAVVDAVIAEMGEGRSAR